MKSVSETFLGILLQECTRQCSEINEKFANLLYIMNEIQNKSHWLKEDY